jgi:hypothetical protein
MHAIYQHGSHPLEKRVVNAVGLPVLLRVVGDSLSTTLLRFNHPLCESLRTCTIFWLSDFADCGGVILSVKDSYMPISYAYFAILRTTATQCKPR